MNTSTKKLSILLISLMLSIVIQAQNDEYSFFTYSKENVHVKTNTQLLKYFALNHEATTLSPFFLDGDLEYSSIVNTLDFLSYSEEYESEQLEDWMFEELVSEEEALPFEDWMFLELSAPEEDMTLEDWMFDTEYFNDLQSKDE